MNPLQEQIKTARKRAVDGRPGRVLRQAQERLAREMPPRAAWAQHVEDRVEDGPQGPEPGRPLEAGGNGNGATMARSAFIELVA